jgi:H+-transporting ATPase
VGAVRNVIPLGGATESDVLSSGAFASQEADQDPIDLAFLRAVKERPDPDGPGVGERIGFIPFDAGSRRTEAVIRREGRKIRVMKGALRSIARVCGWTDAEVRALEEQVAESTSKGYRTLAVAAGPESDVPALIGLVTMYDPPRPDAGKLITRLSGLGVPVKMLTGDALPIAREIAGEVGLAGVRRLKDVESEGAPDGPLTEAGGLAEVYPEDKYLVVRRLQAAGRVVGMTGDGVNDAPALRQAEVGIAVAEATDVAKGAASVVLTEPGLTNILALVEQGRTIYQRILTWVVNKISRTVLKAGFVSIAFVLSGKFVISAFAMLLLVFMNDFAKIALAYDKARPSKRPETWNIGGLAAGSAVLGAVMVAETLLLLWFGWSHFGLAADDGALSTFSFLTLLYFAVFSILSARERRRFWATLPSPILLGALLADAAIGTILTFTGLPGFSPLPAPQILAIFLFAMICCLTLNDAIKVAIVAWRARRAARKADAG